MNSLKQLNHSRVHNRKHDSFLNDSFQLGKQDQMRLSCKRLATNWGIESNRDFSTRHCSFQKLSTSVSTKSGVKFKGRFYKKFKNRKIDEDLSFTNLNLSSIQSPNNLKTPKLHEKSNGSLALSKSKPRLTRFRFRKVKPDHEHRNNSNLRSFSPLMETPRVITDKSKHLNEKSSQRQSVSRRNSIK